MSWTNGKHQPEEARPRNPPSPGQVPWTAKHGLWQVGALLEPLARDDAGLSRGRSNLQSLNDDTIDVGAAIEVLGSAVTRHSSALG